MTSQSFVIFDVSFTRIILESPKLRAFSAKNVLTCQRVLRANVLTGQRVLRAYVLTCQHALRAPGKNLGKCTIYIGIKVIPRLLCSAFSFSPVLMQRH